MLPSGLRYHVERGGSGVHVRLIVLAGDAAGFPESQVGHIVEHLVIEAPGDVGGRSAQQAVAAWGGIPANDANASTGSDSTTYYMNLPCWNDGMAAEALAIVRSWTAPPLFSDSEIDKARRIVAEESRRSAPEEARRLAATRQFFYPGSSLAALSGDPAAVAKVRIVSVAAFARRWYRPSNMILAIAGDIDPAAVERAIAAALGGAAAKPTRRAQAVIPFRLRGEGRVAVRPALQNLTVARFLFKRPRAVPAAAAKEAAIAQIAGGLFSEAQQAMTSHYAAPVLGGGFSFQDMDANSLGIEAVSGSFELRSDAVEPGLDAILGMIETVRRVGFSQTAVARVRDELLAEPSPALRAETVAARGAVRLQGHDPEPTAEAVRAAMGGLDAREVNAALARWLSVDDRDILIETSGASGLDAVAVRRRLAMAVSASAVPLALPPVTPPTLSAAPEAVAMAAPRASEAWLVWTLPRSGARLTYRRKIGAADIRVVAMRAGGFAAFPPAARGAAYAAADVVPGSGLGGLDRFALARYLAAEGFDLSVAAHTHREGLSAAGPASGFETLAALLRERILHPQCRTEALDDLVQRERSGADGGNTDFAGFVMRSVGEVRSPGADALAALRLADVCAAYRTLLGDMSGMTIVAEGDIEPGRLAATIGRYLDIAAARPRPQLAAEAFETQAGRDVLRQGTGTLATARIVLQRASAADATDPKAAGVLKAILDRRLTDRLRGREAATYSVLSSVYTMRAPSALRVSIDFECDAANLERLVAATKEELLRLRREGVTEAEWDDLAAVRAPEPGLADIADMRIAGTPGEAVSDLDRERFNLWIARHLDPDYLHEFVRLPADARQLVPG